MQRTGQTTTQAAQPAQFSVETTFFSKLSSKLNLGAFSVGLDIFSPWHGLMEMHPIIRHSMCFKPYVKEH
jgi:hypothetical protein